MIVTAHPPNYLPGVSVMAKLAQAGAVLWLDEVRFTQPGYVNRNELPDGTWLGVPVDRPSARSLIREVTIARDGWQAEHAAILRDTYGREPHYDDSLAATILDSPAGCSLPTLNLALAARIAEGLGVWCQFHRQSEYPAGGGSSLSDRLARTVRELGGDTYLSGPGGRRSLDPEVFARHGVGLSFFNFAGPNPSAVDPLFRHGVLPTEGVRQSVDSPVGFAPGEADPAAATGRPT